MRREHKWFCDRAVTTWRASPGRSFLVLVPQGCDEVATSTALADWMLREFQPPEHSRNHRPAVVRISTDVAGSARQFVRRVRRELQACAGAPLDVDADDYPSVELEFGRRCDPRAGPVPSPMHREVPRLCAHGGLRTPLRIICAPNARTLDPTDNHSILPSQLPTAAQPTEREGPLPLRQLGIRRQPRSGSDDAPHSSGVRRRGGTPCNPDHYGTAPLRLRGRSGYNLRGSNGRICGLGRASPRRASRREDRRSSRPLYIGKFRRAVLQWQRPDGEISRGRTSARGKGGGALTPAHEIYCARGKRGASGCRIAHTR